ncbi:M48 family metallopeptidase [Asticcacaulis benevestitus]|nr:M48 family metallopeptidase [Asticcacaulis benevestitus]
MGRLGKLSAAGLIVMVAGLSLSGCETNQTLGRSQFLLVDDAALEQSAAAAWQEQLKTAKISKDPVLNKRIQTVGARIAAASGLGASGWEYVLFQDDQPNAFVIPGKKVGINTGLFKVVKNDDQLAAVIGHETAHVLGKHAAERASQQMAAQGVLGAAVGATSGNTQKAISSYGGLGAQLGLLLPYSRKHESEADRIGVDLVAKAGYRPSAAIEVWQNMMALNSGAPPELLSTHPSDKTRIKDLQDYIAAKGYK